MAASPIGEREFIEALRAIATSGAARGLADDAAVLEIGGEALVLTHDAMVEGVHWLTGQDPADVAWKLVAVNLSDLAAKGAEPLGVLLGYSLSGGANDLRFLDGLREALGAFDTALLGGDTVSAGSGSRTLGLTALGRATHLPVPSRQGARSGDHIFLSGSVGAAMMGFEALRDSTSEDSQPYRRPVPLLEQGQALAPHVHAMMDVSDGVLIDAYRMAEASGATFAIDTMAVPIAAPERRRNDALRWGDDYQLLFTAPADAKLPIEVARIGEVLDADTAPLLLDGAAQSAIAKLGYLHSSTN